MDVHSIPRVEEQALDFAYRYPFTPEARDIILRSKPELNQKYLKAGLLRASEALERGGIKFTKMNLYDQKYTSLMGYVYARMLVSALNSKAAIEKYIRAESRRAREILANDAENLPRLASSLRCGIVQTKPYYSLRMEEFLLYSGKSKELSLVKQELYEGTVYLAIRKAAVLLGIISIREIRRNLPIPAGDLPLEVVASSKSLPLPEPVLPRSPRADTERYGWIEKILANPISDVRHRTVNLILAPYLVNVRGMRESDASKVISEYIARCKELNPDTDVNSSYITYQCRYSKAKGLKPLSLDNAKSLLSHVLDLDNW